MRKKWWAVLALVPCVSMAGCDALGGLLDGFLPQNSVEVIESFSSTDEESKEIDTGFTKESTESDTGFTDSGVEDSATESEKPEETKPSFDKENEDNARLGYTLDIGAMVVDSRREEELFQRILAIYLANEGEDKYYGSYTSLSKTWALGNDENAYAEGVLTEEVRSAYNAKTGEGYVYSARLGAGCPTSQTMVKIFKGNDTFYRYEKALSGDDFRENLTPYSSVETAWMGEITGINGIYGEWTFCKLLQVKTLAEYRELYQKELENAAVWPTVSIYENGDLWTLQILIQDGYNVWETTRMTVKGGLVHCVSRLGGYSHSWIGDGQGYRYEEYMWRTFNEARFEAIKTENGK